ncbi:MAG: alpha/beta hydrolase [Candidatus Atribacteria bacterium]|nr:alpha/beta hydrolase [Candidatus Atribacteria bacterium]
MSINIFSFSIILAENAICKSKKNFYCDTKQSEIKTEIFGEGQVPIVLIHGLGLTRQIWYPTIGKINKKNLKIVIYDLSTHGQSKIKSWPPSIDKHAEDVFNIIKFNRIEKFILIGHSYGGRIAQRFVELYPSRVAALGLISTWHGPFNKKDLKVIKTKFKIALLANKIIGILPKWMVPDFMYYFSRSPNLNDFVEFNECISGRASHKPDNQIILTYSLHARNDYTIPYRLGLQCGEYWNSEMTTIDGYIHQIPSSRPEMVSKWIISIVDDVQMSFP